jgi:RimJ/RimL family protein N-acetyltransferase
MAVITRLATPDDAEQLIAHVQRLLHEPDRDVPLEPGEFTLTVEQERQVLAEYAATPNAVFLVAEADGAIVGELNCKGSPRQALRHAVTLGISVRQEWRGQGVGSQLMAAAVAWAQQTGIVRRIELYVYARNAAAIHLYEKFGFVVEGRRRHAIFQRGAYLDDLIMARLL